MVLKKAQQSPWHRLRRAPPGQSTAEAPVSGLRLRGLGVFQGALEGFLYGIYRVQGFRVPLKGPIRVPLRDL